MSIPSTMRAVIVQENKTIAVQEVPVPTIKDNEVLIKVHAIAQNPTDWKEPGSISGVDYAGVVVKVGTSVTNLKVGDQVSSFTFGGTYKDVGAFAEYAKADADLVWLVPSGTITLEEASTMNCALWTAIQALYNPTRLGLVDPPSSPKDEWVFIYAGSTSVGQFAIQLAHLSGYKVITVASPSNHALVKGLGADVVLDYKEPDVSEKIRQITNNSLHHAFDTFSEEESQLTTIRAMGIGAGRIIVLQTPHPAAIQERLDVKIQHTLIYTAFGNDIKWPSSFWPASSADRAHMVSYIPKITEFLRHGTIRPNKVKLWEGGLDGVQQGFEYMRGGHVKAEKIVYKVASN